MTENLAIGLRPAVTYRWLFDFIRCARNNSLDYTFSGQGNSLVYSENSQSECVNKWKTKQNCIKLNIEILRGI